MPVLSPHRSSSSGLTGSYRTTFSSSTLDRPLYGTSSYNPRISTYSERFTSRTYSDIDGHKYLSRTGSITEDGVTTRYREETRELSSRRDSGISSIRENSILDTRREPSLTRSEGGRSSEPRISALNVFESVADLRNKYSPANYVPTVLRNKENISRSKTLNDIGLPPFEPKSAKKKVTEVNINNSSLKELANNTNCTPTDNMYNQEDDNGNRPSVSEICKRFDVGKNLKTSKSSPLVVEGATVKIAENRFKKLDGEKNGDVRKVTKKLENGVAEKNGISNKICKFSEVKKTEKKNEKNQNQGTDIKKSENRVERKNDVKKIESDIQRTNKFKNNDEVINELKGGKSNFSENDLEILSKNNEKDSRNNHVTDFASYIPNKDLERENATDSIENGVVESNFVDEKIKKVKDIATSPRLNRSPISQNASNTEGPQRNSSEKETFIIPSVRRNLEEEKTPNSRASPIRQMGLNGLKNIGNTCFMNSVIQCLSNTKPLLEYLKKDSYVNDMNTTTSGMKGALIKAFAQVIKELWSEDSSDRVVNTTSLKSQIQRFAPRFMGYSQQDAQEFLRYLLEGLHEDVNRVTAKPTPIHTEIDEKLSDSEKASESWQRYLRRENSKVVDIFVGQLKSTLKCTHCGHCSVTFDPFWDLSLPIPQKTGPIRLSQCLDSFTREETLDGDEKPTCSKCKERRKCTKSFKIHKFPKILVIHLKRFSPTERFRGKLNVTVDFPLEGLDMTNYAAEAHTQCRYNLYALSNHSGTTYSGHYTAYCRHPYSQAWHEYNDSRVTTISAKSTVSGEAYVLFYELEGKLSHL